MSWQPTRDLVGYAANPPDPKWPNGPRVPVNFVVNYEEGSEPSVQDGDGYTELEEYLNFMSEPHYLTTPGKSVSVDLEQLFAGFTNGPSYSSAGAENGTAAISSSSATFTPGDCGHARFSVKVTDKDGSSMTRDVFVFIDAGKACH